jgi:hypothetical protein
MRAHKGEHKTATDLARECRKALGLSRCGRYSLLAAKIMDGNAPTPTHSKPTKPKAGVVTEADLRMRHDSVFRVQQAAAAIPEGEFIPESEFVSQLNLVGGYRVILERAEFTQYRGKARGGPVYWGHPKSIKAMKDEQVLV